jgi:hypothetical protein
MPNAILFRDTPIATPIANPAPIILYGTLLISKTTYHPSNKKSPIDQCITSAFSAF